MNLLKNIDKKLWWKTFAGAKLSWIILKGLKIKFEIFIWQKTYFDFFNNVFNYATLVTNYYFPNININLLFLLNNVLFYMQNMFNVCTIPVADFMCLYLHK